MTPDEQLLDALALLDDAPVPPEDRWPEWYREWYERVEDWRHAVDPKSSRVRRERKASDWRCCGGR